METNTSDMSSRSGIRSDFLTIICILSFIGSGLGIVSDIRGYLGAENTAATASEKMEKVQDKMDEQGRSSGFLMQILTAAGKMSAATIRKLSVISLIASLFTLTGAIMMWNLKKTGFYIYTLGIVIIILSPLIFMDNILGYLTAGFWFVFGGMFVVMYAANLKHMNK